MAKLSSYELLSRVWSECSFDEILDYGLSNNYIGSESIINAASDYSDPNKEFSDDELKDIIKEADLDLILDVLDEKYTLDEVIGRYDSDDILNCFDADTLIDFCEYELSDKYEEERNKGFEEGYDEGWNDALIPPKNILNDGSGDERWKYFCNELGVGYYDENNLKEKLNDVLSSFDKTVYKKSNEPWKI